MTDKNKELVATAMKRFKRCEEAEHENRKNGLEAEKFRLGEQWPNNIKTDREAENRPCLVINQVPKFVRDVTNEQRENRPGVKISPTDDQSVDEAQIREGMIRHILTDVSADIAIDTASDSQVVKGWGYLRVLTDYCDERSFDQDVKVKPIKNAFTVYMDPYSEPFDPQFCFVVSDMETETYKQDYPDSDLASIPFETIGDQAPEWLKDGAIRVAEYWLVKKQKQKIYLLEDGTVVDKLEKGQSAVKTRDTEVRSVCMYKINAVEVLEENEWAGKYIPIIPVLGDDFDVNGKRVLKGMVADMMDPQRQYNYWTSASTEAIALAPKAPFIMAEGQQSGYENYWQQANTKNFPYILYKPITINGTLAPAPQRQIAEPPVQAMMQAIRQANEDLNGTTGIYSENLGEDTNATSGKAIIARQKQGNMSTFHYVDNLSRSMRHLGTVLDDLIYKIYDTARIVQIVHEDGTHEPVKINQPFQDGDKTKHYDLSKGKYTVVVETGPSYSTRREQAAEGIAQLAQAYPPLMQIAGDILVKNLDWPEAQLIAKRLKVMLPPQVQQADDGEEDQVPPQIKQQMAEMHDVIQKGQQHIQELTAQVNDKSPEQQNKTRELDLKEKETKLKGFDSKLKLLKEVPTAANDMSDLMSEVDQITGEDMTKEEQAAQHQQLLQGLTGIQQMMGALIQEISKPSVVMRDANGQIQGVKKL